MKKLNFKKTILTAMLFLLGVIVFAQPRLITLNSLTPNSICQGSSTIVNFTVWGTFNFGNIFNVELSDNLGSFVSSTIIGTLNGRNPGTFNITTNPIIVIGTGYRIRVISSNPGRQSGSLPITINIYPGPNPIIKIY